MIRKTFGLLVLAMVLLLVVLVLKPPLESQAETSPVLRKHTFSIGGGLLEGSQLKLQAVFGQPSVVGELSGSSMKLSAGYLAGALVNIENPEDPENKIFLPLVVK